MRKLVVMLLLSMPLCMQAQQQTSFVYKVETVALASNGTFAPLWLTSNRYGVLSNEENQFMLRTGLGYQLDLGNHWKLNAGLDLVGGRKLESEFWLHQAYVDVSWKKLNVSIGSKERMGAPLDKTLALSGGWMVEGPNVRPIPQVRIEVYDYLPFSFTNYWLAFKGHVAYGWFSDGNWQENFAGPDKLFTKNVLYHSKSLMFRLGDKAKFPMDFEFGLITAAQFGGKRFQKNSDGTTTLVSDMSHGIKDFFQVFIPKQKSTLENVSGNHCGSWNVALNAYCGSWKLKAYMEHYFEDHSQMFWQYGRWKDGVLGFEISFPKNCWVSTALWEGMATKDQTNSVLYDGVGGSFGNIQMSGNDHYYNNFQYLGWQYYGASLGHPFLFGPHYNADGSNEFKSTRVRSNHLGISGHPTKEWSWRLLTSFIRHWGTYRKPLDKQRKQFSSLLELSYSPRWGKGWNFSASLGYDRGNYLGNNTGGMLSFSKTGGFNL